MVKVPDTALYISPYILQKIMFYSMKVNSEIGALGTVEFDTKNNTIFVNDLYLLEQEVSAAECTLASKSIASLMDELIQKGEEDKLGKLNFWWHSHHTMKAFFSTIDDTTIKEWPGQYLISLVTNRKMEMEACVMSRVPITTVGVVDVFIDWLDVYDYEEMSEEVTKKIKTPKPTTKFVGKGVSGGVFQLGNGMFIQKNGVWFPCDIEGNPTGKGSNIPPWSKPKEKDKSIHDLTDEELAKIDEEVAELGGTPLSDDIKKDMYEDWGMTP